MDRNSFCHGLHHAAQQWRSEAEQFQQANPLLWVICRAIGSTLMMAFHTADCDASLDRAIIIAWGAYGTIGDLIATRQGMSRENFYRFVIQQERNLEQALRQTMHDRQPATAV